MMKLFVIRCGTPDCEWGHKMHDLGPKSVAALLRRVGGNRTRVRFHRFAVNANAESSSLINPPSSPQRLADLRVRGTVVSQREHPYSVLVRHLR